MKIFTTAFLAFLAATTNIAFSQNAANANIVKAELLADTTAVKPDTTFTLGVLFKVQPGWHIYWRNPGSSGLATKVTFAVPEGGSVGETLYPAPSNFTAPGDIVSYGYEEEVLLMTEARVAPNATGQVEINAKCSWLMCSDRCIPGKQNVTLKLPVAAPQAANQQVFAKYKALLPKASNTLPAGVSVKAAGSAGKTALQLTVAPPAGHLLVAESRHPDLHQLFFFPDNQDGWVMETPQVSAPSTSVQVSNAALKAYDSPATISIPAEPTGASTKGSPLLQGVLVKQVVGKDGKIGNLESFDLKLAVH
jgi:thiol:disulfide interchange protein DsbD